MHIDIFDLASHILIYLAPRPHVVYLQLRDFWSSDWWASAGSVLPPERRWESKGEKFQGWQSFQGSSQTKKILSRSRCWKDWFKIILVDIWSGNIRTDLRHGRAATGIQHALLQQGCLTWTRYKHRTTCTTHLCPRLWIMIGAYHLAGECHSTAFKRQLAAVLQRTMATCICGLSTWCGGLSMQKLKTPDPASQRVSPLPMMMCLLAYR